MEYQLKSVALHITNECSGHCPQCYYTNEEEKKREGKLEILKQIALELKKAKVEEINLVGGDPAEYSHIQELVEYLYNLGFRVPILSNTHNYKNTTLEKIIPYVTSLEGTFHAPTALEHNAFNRTKHSYETMLANLKKYDALRNKKQKIGAVLNIMNHNYNHLYEIIERLLYQGLRLDYCLIQRIGLYGKAKGNEKEKIEVERLVEAFKQIERINKELKVESVMVDAFPFCLIPKEYHKYLDKCDWGYGTASLDMNGDITRCAVASHCGSNLLGNVLETPVSEIWQNAPTLIHFRKKDYLRKECQNCNMLSKCGGGCPISYGNNELSNDALVKTLK